MSWYKKLLDASLLLNIRNLEMNVEGLQKNFSVSEDIDWLYEHCIYNYVEYEKLRTACALP